MMLEAEFKARQCATWRKENTYDTVMCIETEETEPGFPDVICLIHGKRLRMDNAIFYEFKASDSKGIITFQKSQPMFYKKHPKMCIRIIALDNRDSSVKVFPASAIFDGEFKINDKREVQL